MITGKDIEITVASRVVVPSVDGFYCALFEAPLLQSEGSVTKWIFEGDRQWIFAGSVQQISVPQSTYENPTTWKGYGDFAWHHSYKTTIDNSLELVLVDDEFSGVLNMITTWFYASPHVNLTYKTVYRPSLSDPQGITYEEKKKEEFKGNYKGNLLVLCFTPAVELTYAILFLNVFPTTLPLNSLQLDVANVQIRLLNTTFMFDKVIVGPSLMKKVREQSWFGQLVGLISCKDKEIELMGGNKKLSLEGGEYTEVAQSNTIEYTSGYDVLEG